MDQKEEAPAPPLEQNADAPLDSTERGARLCGDDRRGPKDDQKQETARHPSLHTMLVVRQMGRLNWGVSTPARQRRMSVEWVRRSWVSPGTTGASQSDTLEQSTGESTSPVTSMGALLGRGFAVHLAVGRLVSFTSSSAGTGAVMFRSAHLSHGSMPGTPRHQHGSVLLL